MPVGVCPLCKKTTAIVDSHLIPKAVYNYCRPPDGHPIAVSSKFVGKTDRQIHSYLLCSTCENDLNSGGETWLLPLLAEYDGPFPFYDILNKTPPAIVHEKSALYGTANNPGILCDKLAHFALGVFWKASVHSWSGSTKTPMIDLGPYREPVRAFLRKELPFPENVTLGIVVMPPPVKMTVLEQPYRGLEKKWHNFVFYIPGIRFVIGVGKSTDTGSRSICFMRHPARPILVSDFSQSMYQSIHKVLKDPRNAQRFEKLGREVTRPS